MRVGEKGRIRREKARGEIKGREERKEKERIERPL